MSVLWMILVGLVVGALAKLVMPGRDPGGIIVTILLGIGGSVVAGLIGRALGWYAANQGAGFFASLFGAIAILAVYRWLIGRGSSGGGHIRRAA
ncbi:MAG TPA: GlsB/YeaQ/YmgE family stress response membrane protein [Terriglobia bacterium]|nr:GlsB/YeaQ/YmgE family stress response membrane protein [Terriglobia bacterium]